MDGWMDGWMDGLFFPSDPVSVPNITKLTAQSAKDVCGANCSVENGPGVNLTWYKRDIIVGQISNQNTSTLTLLLEIQPENITIYSCCAQNPVSVERKTLSSEWHPCHNSGTISNSWFVLEE
ncbi:hypothetical protein ILYODFUR_013855 [Ilyodon furcidens]|uniref:Ig-like domain-containing protein n=1 Tax=Ilyodon furcidens TaxID=33524 RepID=A0ABV0V6F2_9TELE